MSTTALPQARDSATSRKKPHGRPHGPARRRRRALRLRRRRVRPRARHPAPASSVDPWASGATGCRPACSCARARAGTSTPPASTPSRRTSSTAACGPRTTRPIPLPLYLDHAEWFREQKGHRRRRAARRLADAHPSDGFVATMADGSTITAEKVLAAPGIRAFVERPTWAEQLPPASARTRATSSTSSGLAGARVVVVGGRQSAYEWAALPVRPRGGLGRRRAPPRRAGLRGGQLGVRRPVRRADPGDPRAGGGRSAPRRGRRSARSSGRPAVSPSNHGSSPRLRPEVVTSHPFCEVVDVVADDTGADPGRAARSRTAPGSRPTSSCSPPATGPTSPRSPTSHRSSTAWPSTRASRTSARASRRRCRACSSPASRRPRTSARSSAFTKGCPAAATLAVTEMLR